MLQTGRIFGPKPTGDGTWRIGHEEIKFQANGDIKIGQQVFAGTRALYHFLFKRTMPPVYTDEDIKAYTRILHVAGIHRRAHDPVKYAYTYKYKNVISPLIDRSIEDNPTPIFAHKCNNSQSCGSMTGDGYKLITDQGKDYVHYSDPNELVDRLRLLVAAEQAGNDIAQHHNEIETILQELRECGIITE